MSILYLFAKRFIGGETMEEAFRRAHKLNDKGFLLTMDFLGEDTQSVDDASEASSVYLELLDGIKREGINSNISLKLTQFGLCIGRDIARDNLKKVIDKAGECDNFVRIDMEGSQWTSLTLDLFYEVFEENRNVGIVIQSYLRRSMEDIKKLIEKGARVRICKGAYKEPPDIAFKDKRDTDRNFIEIMKLLLKYGNYPAIGTHDEKIIEEAKTFAKKEGISPEMFEFQMLYGIRPKLQEKILEDGYKMRIYMPFGTHWLPYTLRRLRERRENILFVIKNLFRS